MHKRLKISDHIRVHCGCEGFVESLQHGNVYLKVTKNICNTNGIGKVDNFGSLDRLDYKFTNENIKRERPLP